jgi:hypothetical protein
MSEITNRERLMDIYRHQAALGLGCMNEYIEPMSGNGLLVGGYDDDFLGDGLMVGGFPVGGAGKRNAYTEFVSAFAQKHRGKYAGPEMIRRAAAAWKRKNPKKKLTKAQLQRINKHYANIGYKGQCLDQRDDGRYFLNSDYNCVYNSGEPVNLTGAKKPPKRSPGKRDVYETPKGYYVNGRYMKKADFESRTDKYYKNLGNKGQCLYQDPNGLYYLRKDDYACVPRNYGMQKSAKAIARYNKLMAKALQPARKKATRVANLEPLSVMNLDVDEPLVRKKKRIIL